MGYKLLALDLDGTVVSFTGKITPTTKAEIARIAKNRTKIVIATGRSYQTARPYMNEIGLIVPMILLQGGLVVDEHGVPRRRLLLSPQIVAEVLPWAQRHDVGPVLFSNNNVYAKEYKLPPAQYQAFFSKRLAMVSDLSEKAHQLIDKVILVGTEAQCDAVYPQLAARFAGRAEITRSWRHFLEVTPLGATKGAALAWLAERLGIQQQEVVAVGDALNDLSMIRWAGAGVAMGNTVPELVAAADFVAPTVEEDGLVVALRHHFPPATGR